MLGDRRFEVREGDLLGIFVAIPTSFVVLWFATVPFGDFPHRDWFLLMASILVALSPYWLPWLLPVKWADWIRRKWNYR